MLDSVLSLLGGSKLDAIICVAGGWAGGNAKKGKNQDVGCTPTDCYHFRSDQEFRFNVVPKCVEFPNFR